MLDTVTFREPWRLRVRLPRGRQFRFPTQILPGVKGQVDASGEMLKSVECSLPQLLFEENGHVLEDQKQIDASLVKLRDGLAMFADVGDHRGWQPWRADMAWNYDWPAPPLILAHATLRLPSVRSGATLHRGGQGVSWRGAKSRLMVTIYDKCREMRVPGSVLRAEVALRGEMLHRYLKGHDWRIFHAQWRAYRGIMTSLPPIQGPSRAGSLLEAIGHELPEIRNRILARLAHRPDRTWRRWRECCEAAAANQPGAFSWADSLPIEGPPPPVNVEPRRRL